MMLSLTPPTAGSARGSPTIPGDFTLPIFCFLLALVGRAQSAPPASDSEILASFGSSWDRRLPAEDLVQIHKLIKPQSGESKWAQIPWMISLWEARQKAGAEGKPLFIWV